MNVVPIRTGLLLLGPLNATGAWTRPPRGADAESRGHVTTVVSRGGPAAVVRLTDMLTFQPKVDTIAVGQTVEWINGSVLVHTVTADPSKATQDGSAALPEGAEAFDSGNLEPGAKFSHRFTVAGLYRYFCIPHEGARMIGEIVVLPAKRGA